ncbi:hypothetical protein AB833_01525 [Chromatiales bacterium (ex Bugula neritina AB1)]|nr:hypothetical protein AB833_01525 [Chromatiales bacterium (ex Bugula neritina AB1)]
MSHQQDSELVAERAIEQARNGLSAGSEVGWALAFCGSKHDPAVFLSAVRECLGGVPVYGGACAGAITNSALGYGGFECAIALFDHTLGLPQAIVVDNLQDGEYDAGKDLGNRLQAQTKDDSAVILLYDSVEASPPPVLHIGSALLDGIYAGLGARQLHMVGAGTIIDLQLTASYLFDGSNVVKHTAVALALPEGISAETRIMHGCSPVSSFFEITRIEGPEVFELDGRPAIDVIREISGGEPNIANGDMSLIVTLGRKYGDLYSDFSEGDYVNRLVIATNPDNGSIILFESDYEPGAKVQVMSVDTEVMLESVSTGSTDLLRSLQGKTPLFASYFNCGGRASPFSGTSEEDAAIVQRTLTDQIPLLGCYTGVEIGPLLGRSRPLDWTGVLTVFTLDMATV